MMDDIKSGKDEVSYVLVYKLSRFGRNAADVLATLQVMQDFGVNLICVEDGMSDGTLWEGQIALYFRWTCLPDCAVPELDADYRRNNRRLS